MLIETRNFDTRRLFKQVQLCLQVGGVSHEMKECPFPENTFFCPYRAPTTVLSAQTDTLISKRLMGLLSSGISSMEFPHL